MARSRIRYRGNGFPPRKMQFGPPTNDQVNGFKTYEDKRVKDDYGFMVDPKFGGGPDIDETKTGGTSR